MLEPHIFPDPTIGQDPDPTLENNADSGPVDQDATPNTIWIHSTDK